MSFFLCFSHSLREKRENKNIDIFYYLNSSTRQNKDFYRMLSFTLDLTAAKKPLEKTTAKFINKKN
jgi:hypothetical protein